MRLEETDRFTAADADGNAYTILEFTELHDAPQPGGSHWVGGLRQYRLPDGQPLNQLDDEGKEFQIVLSNVIVRKQ